MTDKIWRDIVALRESMALMQAETKWPPICKGHFQMHFSWMKTFDFQRNSIKIPSFVWSYWRYTSIGLDNSLAPIRR